MYYKTYVLLNQYLGLNNYITTQLYKQIPFFYQHLNILQSFLPYI